MLAKRSTCLLVIGLAFILPVIAGTIGTASSAGSLSWDNASWILFWSAPFSIVAVGISGIAALAFRSGRLAHTSFVACSGFVTLIISGFAMWFLDQVSGV